MNPVCISKGNVVDTHTINVAVELQTEGRGFTDSCSRTQKPLQTYIYEDGNDVKQDFVFICIMCNAPLPQGLTISDVV